MLVTPCAIKPPHELQCHPKPGAAWSQNALVGREGWHSTVRPEPRASDQPHVPPFAAHFMCQQPTAFSAHRKYSWEGNRLQLMTRNGLRARKRFCRSPHGGTSWFRQLQRDGGVSNICLPQQWLQNTFHRSAERHVSTKK